MMKKMFAALIALALPLGLTACGSGNQNAQTSQPAASQTTSSQATATGGAVERIKAAGEIVMLTNATFPPFEYIGEGGAVSGVDVDVATEIAKDLGVSLSVQDMNFDLLIDSLKADKGDFVAAGMTINPERQAQVDFSIEYVKSAQYVVVKKDSGITKDQLEGLTIAVQESTTGDFYATDESGAAEVLRFKNATETGSALKAGKCDAIIIDKLPAEEIAKNSGGELMVLPESLTEESYAFAVKKGNEDLLEVINTTLQRLVDEGSIDSFVSKHMTQA